MGPRGGTAGGGGRWWHLTEGFGHRDALQQAHQGHHGQPGPQVLREGRGTVSGPWGRGRGSEPTVTGQGRHRLVHVWQGCKRCPAVGP